MEVTPHTQQAKEPQDQQGRVTCPRSHGSDEGHEQQSASECRGHPARVCPQHSFHLGNKPPPQHMHQGRIHKCRAAGKFTAAGSMSRGITATMAASALHHSLVRPFSLVCVQETPSKGNTLVPSSQEETCPHPQVPTSNYFFLMVPHTYYNCFTTVGSSALFLFIFIFYLETRSH